jgi:hypothetical protein
VLWICISFNAHPKQAFYRNVDPDPGRQTNADQWGSGSWSDFKVKKVNFYMKNILKVGDRSKDIPTKVQKPF